MGTEQSVTLDGLTRLCRWIGGITPEDVAAMMAEVLALPGPARTAHLSFDIVTRGNDPQATGIPGVEACRMMVVLTLGGRPWPAASTGAARVFVRLSATAPNAFQRIVEMYADALAQYAATRAGEPLRAAHTKAARDQDVAEVQTAVQGLRGIAARMRTNTEGGR